MHNTLKLNSNLINCFNKIGMYEIQNMNDQKYNKKQKVMSNYHFVMQAISNNSLE